MSCTNDRFSLSNKLNSISQQHLDTLIWTLKAPFNVVPPSSAPHGDRTNALLNWADSGTGCGLEKLQDILHKIISGYTNDENISQRQQQQAENKINPNREQADLNTNSESEGLDSNMIGLLEVFGCNNPKRRGDIIFVHGWAGHPWATWHRQDQRNRQDCDFWLPWLGEELQQDKIDVGIWSFGYEAPLFQSRGSAISDFAQVSNLLVDPAISLLDNMKTSDVGKRPLIFVAHSMGGLLVKQAIRTAQNFDDKKISIKNTRGIVFLSTPHRSSHLTKFIENFSVLANSTVNVKELKGYIPRLRGLNEWYRENIESLAIDTRVFYETEPIHEIVVLDKDSANPDIQGIKAVAAPYCNHNTIAKPQKNDFVYDSTRNFIKEKLVSVFSMNNFHQEYVGLEDKIRKHEKEIYTAAFAAVAAAIPGTFAPGLDFPTVTAIWIRMIIEISKTCNRQLDKDTVIKFTSSLLGAGAAYVGGSKIFAMSLQYVIPGIGTLGALGLNSLLNFIYTIKLGRFISLQMEKPEFDTNDWAALIPEVTAIVFAMPSVMELREYWSDMNEKRVQYSKDSNYQS